MKTAEIVARAIATSVSREGIEPGERLPSEKEMLTQYDVGRGTLREALRYLELQGLISIKPGSRGGPVLSQPDPRGLAAPLSLMLQLSKVPFRAVIESRELLEPAIAAAAARHASPEHIDELRESIRRMSDIVAKADSAPGNHVDEFLEENRYFHAVIADASGNAVLTFLLVSLQWIIDGRVLGVDYPTGSQEGTLKLHKKIVDAIAAHDADAASSAAQRHIAMFDRFIQETYPQVLDRTIEWE